MNPTQLSNTIHNKYTQDQITYLIVITLFLSLVCVHYSMFSIFMLIPALIIGATLGFLLSASEPKKKKSVRTIS